MPKWDCARRDMENFGLPRKDAQDNGELRINRKLTNRGLPGNAHKHHFNGHFPAKSKLAGSPIFRLHFYLENGHVGVVYFSEVN